VARQNLRLVLGDVSELTFEGVRNLSMQRTSWISQQRSIGCVLYERVLEQIRGVGRDALPEQQTSRNDTVECRLKLRLRLADNRR